MTFKKHLKTPVGILCIESDEDEITSIYFTKSSGRDSKQEPACLKKAVKQLTEYFSGKRSAFDLPLKIEGTSFQKKVWRELEKISFGTTLSYGDIAKKIKNPNASRAVGLANNKNKFTIVIPCHRVIGSTGKLVGYASGVNKKQWLLQHEASL